MPEVHTLTGRVAAIRRYINVPLRLRERQAARERRELRLTTSEGDDIGLVVHSRLMPARSGHVVTVLLIDDTVAGLHNVTTGRHVNFIRADPPLLLRARDFKVLLALLLVAIAAAMAAGALTLLATMPVTLLYLPVLAVVRAITRRHVQIRIDRFLDELQFDAVVRPLRRPK